MQLGLDRGRGRRPASLIGVPLSWVPLTAVPQRTAVSHAFGGLAAGLVGRRQVLPVAGASRESFTAFRTFALVAEVILGFLTFTGSLMAAGKLQEVKWIPQRPVTYPFQNAINIGLLGVAVACGIALVFQPVELAFLFPVIVALALAFGVLLIIPIGGADMPTVISLLNSYAGLSAVAMGFVLDNKLLVIAGALDGSSGLILSIIMCRAMNRSFTNVLFGAFGQVQAEGGRRRDAHGQEGDARGRRPGAGDGEPGGDRARATAWRWPRPSSACASSTTSSRSAGSR